MSSNASLVFYQNFATVGFGIFLVAAVAAVAGFSWCRSGYARGVGALEGLRIALALMVAITLCQPEWLQEFQPEQEPTIAVLWDQSSSMETRDVINASRPSDPAKSRADWLAPFRKNEAIWQPIASRFKVVSEPFSSTKGDPALGTDLNGALSHAVDHYDNLCGVVLFSDGDWNEGEPPIQAASRLRAKGIPVFTVGIGSESRMPDIKVTRLDAPTFGIVNKPMRIPFSIRSSLPQPYHTQITLTSSTGEQITRDVVVPAMGTLNDAMIWKPSETGEFDLTLRVPTNKQESLTTNNQRSVPIAIRKESLQVLIIESFPRWEYRYLRNALERDSGVDVSCLLLHPNLSKVGGGRGYLKTFPSTLAELSKYDVVFIGDVGLGTQGLSAEQCSLIKGLVQNQASGLILMPGRSGRQLSLIDSELGDLFPVVLDAGQPNGWGSRTPYQFELTEAGRRSLLTKLADTENENASIWESLPGFQWYAPVLRAKSGSEVLAVHRSESSRFGRIPLLATKTYGVGKVLFMGTDGAWRWREGVEDRYHYRFWGQVARWMAYQRNMAQGDSMRLFTSPDRPEANAVVTLNVNAQSISGEPLQSGHVNIQAISPSGKTESIRLTSRNDQWGLFTGDFTPTEPGNYQMIVTCRENGATLETKMSVQGGGREQLGEPARFDVLQEIAEVTRGQLMQPNAIQALMAQVSKLPDPEPITRRLKIWCHPAWGALILILLGLFWAGRKLVGQI